VTVVGLAFFSLFAILHVAMQLQRKEIMVSFARAIFLKVVSAAVAGKRLPIIHFLSFTHTIEYQRSNILN
jgi:hypothetical protein